MQNAAAGWIVVVTVMSEPLFFLLEMKDHLPWLKQIAISMGRDPSSTLQSNIREFLCVFAAEVASSVTFVLFMAAFCFGPYEQYYLNEEMCGYETRDCMVVVSIVSFPKLLYVCSSPVVSVSPPSITPAFILNVLSHTFSH